MKLKKRLTISIIALIVLVLIAGLAVYGVQQYQYYTHSRDHQYLLDVLVDPAGESGYNGPLPANYTPGQERTISFTVSNHSYIPVQVREVLLLSVYDQSGAPVFLDGSPYTASSVELLAENKTLTKALEKHQAVYVSEYALDAGKPLFEARSGWEDSEGSTTGSNYTLAAEANSPYVGYTLRLDLFLYGRPQAYPYADWQPLTSVSNILENASVPAALETSFAESLSVPAFSASQAYHWELDSGKALLVDAGNMQDPDAVIPEKIWLSETPDGYVEDPVTGTCYDVKVKGNAFYDNKWLQTVSFQDGVSVAGNIMWDGRKQGMFEGCTALTAVNNIPDGVLSMEETFQRCSALESMPQLPATVENLSGCFLGCSALQEVSPIPEKALFLKACFQGCTALKETPVFPKGVTDLSDCFYGCAALETVAPLPESVTILDRTFSGCTSLTTAPVLPEGLKSMAATFYSCSKLTEIKNLPDTVVNLQSCFKQCSNLETVPELPAEAFILDECFYGCTNLSGSVTIPVGIFPYSDFFFITSTRMFEGCEALETIFVDGCPNALETEWLSTDIPVRFTKTHTRGTCESCHIYSDTFEVNGLTVVMDEIPEAMLPMFMELLETIPESLIPTCNRLIFTSNWNHGESFAGMYYFVPKDAFIRIYNLPTDYKLNPSIMNVSIEEDIQKAVRLWEDNYYSVVFHELAHGYDRNSSSSILSDTTRWRELHAEEGAPFNPDPELYTLDGYRSEFFAKAVDTYFNNPASLLDSAPNTYAYLDELFGDAA